MLWKIIELLTMKIYLSLSEIQYYYQCSAIGIRTLWQATEKYEKG